MAQAKTTSTPILESFAIPDTFVTELAALENLGPCYRLTFTVNQTAYDGSAERCLVSKVVISAEALQQMLINIPLMTRNLPELHAQPENRAQLN